MIKTDQELWDSMGFGDRVSLAISRMFRNRSGYFYVIFSSFSNIFPNDKIETAAAKYNIYNKTISIEINPNFPKNFKQLSFIIAHEFMHILNGHINSTREKVDNAFNRSKDITNIICDCQINTILNSLYDKTSSEKLFDPDSSSFDVTDGNGNAIDSERIKKRRVVVEKNRAKHRLNITEGTGGFDFDILEDEIKKLSKTDSSIPEWKFDIKKLYNPIEEWIEELEFLYKSSDDIREKIKEMIERYGVGDVDQEDSPDDGQAIDKDAYSESIVSMVNDAMEMASELDGVSNGDDISSGKTLFERAILNLKKPRKRFLIPSMMKGLKEIDRESTYSTYTQYNIRQSAYPYPKKRYLNKKASKIVIGIDISGSISEEELEIMMKKIAQMKNTVDIIFWSSEETIPKENIYKNYKIKTKISPKTTGGTDLSALFKYVGEEYAKEKVCLAIFSDFYVEHIDLPEAVNSLYLYSVDTSRNSLDSAYATWKESVRRIKKYHIVDFY